MTSQLELGAASFLTHFPSPDALAEFYARMDAKTRRVGDCLEWTGEKNEHGYGRITIKRAPARHRFYAHRVAYERAHGPIPDGLTIDHLCRNKACVNPEHHEVVTLGENSRRGTAARHGNAPGEVCKRGHVGEYRRDPRSNALHCHRCHMDRQRAVRALEKKPRAA